MYEKTIIYDPETRDFAMYLDGDLVGFARTCQEADATLDYIIAELLTGSYARDASVKRRTRHPGRSVCA